MDSLITVISNRRVQLVLVVLAVCLVLIFILGVLVGGYYLGSGKALIPYLNSGVSGDEVVIEELGDSTETEKAFYKVDVSGAVVNPGVYEVGGDVRLGEVIDIAGGILSEYSGSYVSKYVNLAAKVSDGMKIYIPFDWDLAPESDGGELSYYGWDINTQTGYSDEEVVTGPSGTYNNIVLPSVDKGNSTTINVNTAGAAELDSLPGIGPAYAQRIVDNRTYKDINEMKEKTKIPQSTLDKISDQISF